MIILDSSENQDEQSPLKKGMDITTPPAALAIAPPPYAPALSTHPVPSYQAIPRPRHHRNTLPRRHSPIRRLLVAFAVACLVLLLWGVFMDSINMLIRGPPPKGHPPRGHPPRGRFGHKLACLQDTFHTRSHLLNHPCKDCPPPCPPQMGIDHPIRILPLRYPPPIHPSQRTESSVPPP